jgi:TolB-like protein
MSFFQELTRRNVVRVGIAYAVMGWVLAQVAEFAFENFGAPDWALKTFVVVLLLGMPLVLFFAWAFEITPEGVKRERDVDRSRSITANTGRKLDFIIIGVMAVAIVWLLADRLVLHTEGDSPEVVVSGSPSIAVLPFVNMSEDDDYFADGLSEELLNLLARIPDLKVAGRTSSFVFKNKTEDLRAIGDALSVATVLEGSVRRSGDRLRITAQLINVEDGFHLWSQTYDRQMADIFDIQDDVARAITDALKLHLIPRSDRPTGNTEAYALYLEALALQVYDSESDIALAQKTLDRAIELDPRFALAYELKSNFYWLEGGWIIDAPVAQKLAYDAAIKALELDPSLAGAKSYARTAHPDWNWIDEIDALEELIAIEPENISALEALCYDLVITGYFAEAAQLAERIVDLEPLAGLGYWRKGEALTAAGRDDEARAALLRTIEFGASPAMWMLGVIALIENDDESAITWIEKALAEQGLDPGTIRPLIENVRKPATGKAYLDQWVETQIANASNLNELRWPYGWYLAFGYLDDYWRAIDLLDGPSPGGWTNADTLEQGGMIFRRTGFARHPRYLPRAKETSLIDLWEVRGAPDTCSKDSGEWVCE